MTELIDDINDGLLKDPLIQATVTNEVTVGDGAPVKHRGLMPPWKPGQSGNPDGRKKGARNRLSEEFLCDLESAWKDRGNQVIYRVIEDRPQDFLKVIASLMPKEAHVSISHFEEMSDEQLRERVARTIGQLRTFLDAPRAGGDAGRVGEEAQGALVVSDIPE